MEQNFALENATITLVTNSFLLFASGATTLLKKDLVTLQKTNLELFIFVPGIVGENLVIIGILKSLLYVSFAINPMRLRDLDRQQVGFALENAAKRYSTPIKVRERKIQIIEKEVATIGRGPLTSIGLSVSSAKNKKKNSMFTILMRVMKTMILKT